MFGTSVIESRYAHLQNRVRSSKAFRGSPMNMTMTTRQVGSVTIVGINGRIVLEECGLLRGLLKRPAGRGA